MREDKDPAGLGAGDVVGVRFGDGRGNSSFSSSFSSSSSSGIRGVAGDIPVGEGGGRTSKIDEPDAEWRWINGTLQSLTALALSDSASRLDVDSPVSLERRRLSISSTLIETPRVPYEAEAALPTTVMVRGLPSALTLRRLEAAREKCSGHVSPPTRAASVTDWHAAQHGRRGTVTMSARDGEGDGFRDGRVCEGAPAQEGPEDGTRCTRQGGRGV